ncbi:isochorismate synthase DhbC [Actinomadura syzygii]|uniref:isochorismate synthase n=1 Tax=Actinomadura syzygii TaxID=1427538 RepID=A0A5D0U0D7_9ACTN|nr:isochorismate synthase DhbC [Actinomadura syzygii]TYC11223.1 isochorismate synthase DhbC [Actinomadura syzygii]
MTILTQSHADLLSDYRPQESFFFRSPAHGLLAQGTVAVVPTCNPRSPADAVARRVRATLAEARDLGQPRPIVVGALPFHPSTPARLRVPRTVRWTGPAPAAAPPVGPPVGFAEVQHVPSPEVYRHGVGEALERLADSRIRKIVLARALHLEGARHPGAGALLRRLAHDNPAGYVFAVDLQPGRTLLGASPELLVQRDGGLVTANPLAGSAPRHADARADARAGERLLASEKDLREHAVVVEAVAEGLRPFCHDLHVQDEPSLLETPTLWHLSTQIRGQLRDPEVTSLHLAAALHPTPAVCGTPRSLAMRAIQEIEPFNRSFYSGAVGWCDSSGDGEWAVAIRCAEVADDEIRIYAGAGIVEGSVPDAELAETSAKFRTFLRAIGIDQDL